MNLGYTEFSFGYAFTENLIRAASTAPAGAPQFPNLVQEGKLGYDIKIDFPGCPLYFQFKLPKLMVRNSAFEISHYGLQGIQTPFFRMYLMKSDLSPQHKLLLDLEKKCPNSVYYVTPCLESVKSFNDAYNAATVHSDSVWFSPKKIGVLPNSEQHSIAYRRGSNFAWLCSEPRQITASTLENITANVKQVFEDERYRTMRNLTETTLKNLLSLASPTIRESQFAIRQRIQERLLPFADQAGIDDTTIDVFGKLLACREIARVCFGLELVIAQPSG